MPTSYGLPKIDKDNISVKPPVSGTGSVTYRTAKCLATFLSPLVGRTEHFGKNSTQFVKEIDQLEVPPNNMASFDVTAIVTSVPVLKYQ